MIKNKQEIKVKLMAKNNLGTKKYLIISLSLLIISLLALGLYFYLNHTLSFKPPIQNINVALSWIHQSEFTGNYVAVEKGFYAENEINASLIPYNFKDLPIDLVVSGKADFGITGASEVLLARSQGIPVKAIAVIYQVNPVCAFSLKSSGITKPTDFIGKKIGVEKGINVEYDYISMMNNLNINRSLLTEIGVGYNASELLDGTVDVSTGYVDNEPYYVIAAGQDVNIIMVEDYGVNTYSDVLFTTDELINKNPKLVSAFVKATIDGWQYTLEHQDEAIGIIMQYTEDKDMNHEIFGLKKSLPLISTGEVPIGYMDQKGWQAVENAVLLQKILSTPINVSDCYTTEFNNNNNNNKILHKI
jgi:NitT/TauT family transport system substrate-binding protein